MIKFELNLKMYDHSFKMKHSDMPMPHPHPQLALQNQFFSPSPIRVPEQKGSSVADHLQRYLLSSETTLTELAAAATQSSVKEQNSRANSQPVKKPKTPSNEPKQVRFDIKQGLQQLISETGIDLSTTSKKQGVTVQAKKRSMTPQATQSQAIKMAFLYKKQVITNQKLREDSSSSPIPFHEETQDSSGAADQLRLSKKPSAHPILIQELTDEPTQSITISRELRKAGSICRIGRFKQSTEQLSTAQVTQNLSQSYSEDNFSQLYCTQHPPKQMKVSKEKSGSILRQTRSVSATRSFIMSPINNSQQADRIINQAVIEVQKVKDRRAECKQDSSILIQNSTPSTTSRNSPDSSFQETSQRETTYRTQEEPSSIDDDNHFFTQQRHSLVSLVQMNHQDLQHTISLMKKYVVPFATQQLHDLLQPEVDLSPQLMLHKIRINLVQTVLPAFFSDLIEIATLKQRVGQHRKLLKSCQLPQEQLKQQIVQDIIFRLEQKLIIKYLQVRSQFKKQVTDQFMSYHRLVIQHQFLRNTFSKLTSFALDQQRLRCEQEAYFQTIQKLKLRAIFQHWSNYSIEKKARTRRNNFILEQKRLDRLKLILQEWKIATVFSRKEQIGKQVADQQRVFRLKWLVFGAWVQQYRSGTKIKRMALNKVLGQKRNWEIDDESKSMLDSGRQQSLLDSSRVADSLKSRAKTLLGERIAVLQEQRAELELEIHRKNLNMVKKESHVNPHQPPPTMEQYPVTDLTAALQPPMYMKMMGQRQTLEQKASLDQIMEIHQLYAQQKLQEQQLQEQQNSNRADLTKELPDIDRSELCSLQTIDKTVHLPVPFHLSKETDTCPINMLFTKMSRKRQLQTKEKIIEEIAHIRSLINQLEKKNKAAFHRTQALFFYFKQYQSSSETTSLEEYTQIIAQNHLSYGQMTSLQLLSQLFMSWKIRYLECVLNKNLDALHQIAIRKQVYKSWINVLNQKEKKALKHHQTRQVQNHYLLFQNWAQKTREIVYTQLKSIRLFRLRFVLKNWREYLQLTETYRNKLQAAQKFRQHHLMTQALVSLYSRKLQRNRINKFQKKWAFSKFFKKQWMPRYKQSSLLRKVFYKAYQRIQGNERSRYQLQYDLLKKRFDTWARRTKEKEELIKTYMALNHYKYSLQFKTLKVLKKLKPQHTACIKLEHLLFSRVQEAFKTLQKEFIINDQVVYDFRQYRSRELLHLCFKNWRQHLVQEKIARLFFQRKYLRHLQDYTFIHCYSKPISHYHNRLKVIAFYTLRDFKLQRWQEERDEIFNRAVQGKYEQNLKKKVFDQLLDNVVQLKQDRIVQQTVQEFRQHSLQEKAFRYWRIYMCLQKRKRLQQQCADEFRNDQLMRKIYKGSLENVCNQQTGIIVSKNTDLMMRVFAVFKKLVRSHLELKLQQYMRAKNQIMLVRTFLQWRSGVKRAQQAQVLSMVTLSNKSDNLKPYAQIDKDPLYNQDVSLSAFGVSSNGSPSPINILRKSQDPSLIDTSQKPIDKSESLVQTTQQKSDDMIKRSIIENDFLNSASSVHSVNRSPLSLNLQYKLLLQQEQENHQLHNSDRSHSSFNLTESGLKDEPLKYTSDLFCQTSRGSAAVLTSDKKQRSEASSSVKSGLFGELDQLYKQQKQWNEEQATRDAVLKQMQLQYQSLKSSI